MEWFENRTSVWKRKMVQRDWKKISEAIVVWTGYGPVRLMYPQTDESRLVDRFGADLAHRLIPLVRKIYDEFYTTNAREVAPDLAKMGAIASAEFKKKYPEILEEAVAALAWCYTFDNK